MPGSLEVAGMTEMEEPPAERSSGDPVPPGGALIEVHLASLRQLFHSLDPSPSRERDLDPKAEEFIVGWAREAPLDAPLCLQVRLDRPAGAPNEATSLRDAIQENFRRRSEESRRRLRQLLRVGRISLLIGLGFLAVAIGVADVVSRAMAGNRFATLVRESFLIGGWVAMWRPLEIFLYDWWPIRAERRLHDRLSAMSVRLVYDRHAHGDDPSTDWPAAPHHETRPPTQGT